MALDILDGPLYTYGNTGSIPSTFASTGPVPDPNQDAGPNASFQGAAFLDPRYFFNKDMLQGYTGRAGGHWMAPVVVSVNQIPSALAANNLVTVANAVSGTAYTFAAASVGVTRNIPIIPFNAGGLTLGTPTTAAVVLDFGFAFGTVVSGNTTITVANSFDFKVGMPLVIGSVGNAGGTSPLLTNVVTIPSTTTITVADAPLSSLNPAPIGAGNTWGPSPSLSTSMYVTPTAHMPWLAGGPGLFLDPRQTVARCVRVASADAAATGGTFTIRGWDVYWRPLAETVTQTAGATTVYSQNCFKALASITPNFSDAHQYTAGTGDVFGIHYLAQYAEDLDVWWAAGRMITQGFTAGLALITTPTAVTADVRGTIQTGAAGRGTGIGATASNGTVSALAMSGNRLAIRQRIGVGPGLFAYPADARTLFGNVPFTS